VNLVSYIRTTVNIFWVLKTNFTNSYKLILCCVYTCRFVNQVPNEKLV